MWFRNHKYYVIPKAFERVHGYRRYLEYNFEFGQNGRK